MKYVIVGSGPTGLSLAYNLALNDKEIILIEQDSQLGGSWNSQYIDNKYWSENSPRILVFATNTLNLLKHIGLKDNNFKNVYGSYLETTYKKISFTYKYFSLFDLIIILLLVIKYTLITCNITLDVWLKDSGLSIKGKKALRILSILMCDKPENTNINDFSFSLLLYGLFIPRQMTEPNKWHNLIEDYLKTKKNITILKNTKVIKLIENKNSIKSVYVKDLINNTYKTIECDKIILCTQSNNLYPLLKSGSHSIKNNWMNQNEMRLWSENTYYSGFGFQLHFDQVVKYNNEFCWSCQDDWTVIVLPVSNWLKKFSKDPLVKTVWSCCIVDMETKSKNINKTANECELQEVIDECLHQINKAYKIPKPYKITTGGGLKKENNKWLSKNTGYTKKNYQDLEMKGRIDNLYALGCFTKNNRSIIAHMGTAIESTVNYLNIYEKNLKVNIFKQSFFESIFFKGILLLTVIKLFNVFITSSSMS